jgi:hypothetical protein
MFFYEFFALLCAQSCEVRTAVDQILLTEGDRQDVLECT